MQAILRRGNPVMVNHDTGDNAIDAGDVLVIGDTVRIAHLDCPANTSNGAALGVGGGVYEVVKSTGAIDDGDPVYWAPTGSPIGGEASSGAATATPGTLKLLGYAVEGDAASGDATVRVYHQPGEPGGG